jgi:hypothetical protein
MCSRDLDDGRRLAAFKRLKYLDLVKYVTERTVWSPLRRHERTDNARGFRLEILLFDRGGEARAADGGRDESEKSQRLERELHDCARILGKIEAEGFVWDVCCHGLSMWPTRRHQLGERSSAYIVGKRFRRHYRESKMSHLPRVKSRYRSQSLICASDSLVEAMSTVRRQVVRAGGGGSGSKGLFPWNRSLTG